MLEIAAEDRPKEAELNSVGEMINENTAENHSIYLNAAHLCVLTIRFSRRLNTSGTIHRHLQHILRASFSRLHGFFGSTKHSFLGFLVSLVRVWAWR